MIIYVSDVDRGVGRGCEICNLAFSRQSALCEHYRRKHSIFFDSEQDSTIANVKRSKRLARDKEKVIIGERSDTGNQQTNATVNLPNGLKLNVVMENKNCDIAAVNDITDLSENLKSNGTDRESVIGLCSSELTDGGSLIETRYLDTTKPFSVSAANDVTTVLSDSISFIAPTPSLTCSSASVGTSAQTTIASTCSANTSLIGSQTATTSIMLNSSSLPTSQISSLNTSTIFSTQELANEYQLCNSVNKVIYEISESTAITCGNFSKNDAVDQSGLGTKYIIVRHLPKLTANNKTGSNLQVTGEVIGESVSKGERINKMDVHGTDTVCVNEKVTNDTVKLSEVDSPSKNVENNSLLTTNESEVKPELGYSVSGKGMKIETSDASTVDSSVNLKLKKFKKKSKLSPAAGKIPQELDMPDFYFLNIVTKSGTHVKNIHAGKDQFKCLFCASVTKWRGNMCRHMREAHSNLLESGGALIMPLQLNTRDGKVMKMTEYIDMEMAKKPNKRKRGVETQDLPGDFPCGQCGKVFNRLRYLRIHLQQHKLQKDFLCALCSKTFMTKNNLNQHLKTHEEREPYKCPECDFESSVNIAIHKHRQIHNANSLLCDICGQAYSDKSTLKKHKQVHDSSRPFGCTIPGCTWRFRTKIMCDAHIQGHGTKRTFKCDLCGYAFRQKHHLQRHEKVVHNIVHDPKPVYRPYFNNADADFNENHFENISTEDRQEMEVSQGVNLIINEGNISNLTTLDHFDLESTLQNGHTQLVIAAHDGTINYEMSDIGNNVVYQTFLPDGEVQQFETQTVSIPQSDGDQIAYEGVETVQSEVEIEQS